MASSPAGYKPYYGIRLAPPPREGNLACTPHLQLLLEKALLTCLEESIKHIAAMRLHYWRRPFTGTTRLSNTIVCPG